MNATENTEHTRHSENAGSSESSSDVDSPAAAVRATEAAEPTEPAETAESGGTSLYVRRGRTPTLGFWVALALALPAVAALISAPFFEFADLGGVFTFVLLAVVFVGLPLAAIAAVIDSIRHRTPRRRSR